MKVLGNLHKTIEESNKKTDDDMNRIFEGWNNQIQNLSDQKKEIYDEVQEAI